MFPLRWMLMVILIAVASVNLLLYSTRGKFSFGQVDPSGEDGVLNYLRYTDTSSCSHVKDLNRLLPNETLVCADPGLDINPGNCLIYWFGNTVNPLSISGLQHLRCQVYVFTPWSQDWNASHWPNVHLHEIGVGYRDVDDDPIDGWKRRTFSSLYEMSKDKHGDMPIDYVAMDIQHAEWSVIPQIIRSGMLNRVKQLSVKLHFYDIAFIEYVRICSKRLKSLEQQGRMIRFSSQLNSSKIQLGRFSQLNSRMFWLNPKFRD